jgi:AraC-like DNA-binding protein
LQQEAASDGKPGEAMQDRIEARIRRLRHDSPLGRWRLAVCTPPPDLADIVETSWLGEGSVRYQRDRILPGGGSQLLVNLGPPQYLVGQAASGGRRPFRDVWYAAPQQRPLDTEAPHGQRLLGIAFHPHGGRSWLGVDGGALADRVLGLDELLGDASLALRERLLGERDERVCFLLVEDWLRRRRQPRREAPAALRWALRRIADSRGQLAIEQLHREIGCSRPHLASLFQRHVGLGAKALARLHRFHDALALLRRHQRVPWVELAALCGYYDQSHLIRDFHAFSGMAPGEFVRLAQPDTRSVVLC